MAFAVVAGICLFLLLAGGPSQPVLIIVVLCTPALALIAPELVEFWSWFAGKAEQRAVQREERIFRFGYTDIRMLMVGQNPWFAADDIASALGLADLDHQVKHFDAHKCDVVGKENERYLSEAGVMTLIGRSRHPDARSFRIWFEREVMFPLKRARENERGTKPPDDSSGRANA